jgi:hypothetical protein
MNMLASYRSSQDHREILRILQKSSALKGNFMWQSLSSGRKFVVPIDYLEIDFVTREIAVFYDKNSFKLFKEIPLYIKLHYQTSVFKVIHFSEELDSIHLQFPKIIKTLEATSSPVQDSYLSLS